MHWPIETGGGRYNEQNQCSESCRPYKQLLLSPGDKKLKKSAIHDAIGQGLFGVSLLKNGRPQIIPPKSYMA